MIETKLPNKEEFHPAELPRYLGISVRTIYRHIESGDLRAEFRSVRVTIIRREWILDYLKRVSAQRNGIKIMCQ